jgi:hypothetical protein
MKNWLCYYEVHVERATYYMYVIVPAEDEDQAVEKMRERAAEHGTDHLQAKGILGEFTPELAMKYMILSEVV